MRRAVELGCSLPEAKARTPEREFRQWAAYYAREPSVGDRIDLMSALVQAAVYNAAPFRSGRRVDPVRFLPKRWERGGAGPGPRGLVDKLLAWGRSMAAMTRRG